MYIRSQKTTSENITIAIPFYNAEAYLADSIRSVFAQTHSNWELILVDDGSTDKSLEIAYSVKDPRVRVIADGKNIKLASRLNQIIDLASYDLIARMDADDLMSPDRLRLQSEILSLRPEIDLVSCGLYSIKNDLSLVGIRGNDYTNYTFDDLIWKRKGFVHAALLARKSWFKRNRYNPDIPLIEDTELWLRAAKNEDFRAMSIATPLYIYREEDNVIPAKLLKAYALERKHLSKMLENSSRRTQYIARSILKTAITKGLNLFDALNWLQQRRNSIKPNEKNISEYQSIINHIRNTTVQGLDTTKSRISKNYL